MLLPLLIAVATFASDPTSDGVLFKLNRERAAVSSRSMVLDPALCGSAMLQARKCAAANAQFHSNSILYGVSEGVCDRTNDPVGALTYPTAPLHRADALNRKWTRLGVGWAYSRNGTIYWVLQYGP